MRRRAGMMDARKLIALVALSLAAFPAAAADDEGAVEPTSLRDAGIVVTAGLLGAGAGPYGVSDETRPVAVIYEGEPVRFFVLIRQTGYFEVALFREDGDLEKQITATLQHGDDKEDAAFEAEGSLYRMDSRGQEAKGFHPLSEGDSVRSVWRLTGELQPGEYQLTIRFAAAGEYEGKQEWERELKPIKFTVKKAEGDDDKLNVLLRKAAGLLDEGKPDEAVAELEKALAAHPTSVFAYEYLGHCYRKKGDSAKAVEMFKKAAEIVAQDQDEKIEFSALEKSECLAYFEDMAAAAGQTE
jgi:tetratricopeptide (TPR) repeat protein